MRRIMFLSFLMVSVNFGAKAQSFSKVDVYGGYSYTRANDNGASSFGGNGGTVSVTYNLTNLIGVVGEFNISHFSIPAGNNLNSGSVAANTETYVFGPRLSPFRGHKIMPFVQVLAGGIRADNSFADSVPSAGSQTRLAIVGGGGLDWKMNEHLAVRLAQVDYLWTHLQTSTNNHQNNFRYSTGVVFHF